MKLIIEIPDDYEPEDGDAFDAVVAALEHFEIPASVYEESPSVRRGEPFPENP